MNSLNFVINATSSNDSLLDNNEELCSKRCNKCDLFPYDKLSSKGIIKTTGLRTLQIFGQQYKVSSHGYRLTCALVRHHNSILSKEYLIKYAWPDSKVVSNNLNVAISELRILFKDTSINITNYRKKGYALSL